MLKRFFKYVFSELKTMLFAARTEDGAFRWVLFLWFILIIYDENNIALYVGIVIFIKYVSQFLYFSKQALSNEWPYNLLGLIGAGITYFILTLTPIASNLAISSVTGFHATFFPNSQMLITAMFIVFAFLIIITVFSFVGALIFRTKGEVLGRVLPIMVMLILCIWPIAKHLIPSLVDGKRRPLLNIESIITNLDFIPNSRITSGRYWPMDEYSRVYGTKICQNYSFDARIAPHAQGGHIIAEPRKIPARLQKEKDTSEATVEATKYVYNYVSQDECKDMQKYYEYPALMTPKNQRD